ncbi:hypothetical protein KM043_007041 [Ampulex compressa]|nr:hypothetical protein KM043_007041 [Ampulex compressa]
MVREKNRCRASSYADEAASAGVKRLQGLSMKRTTQNILCRGSNEMQMRPGYASQTFGNTVWVSSEGWLWQLVVGQRVYAGQTGTEGKNASERARKERRTKGKRGRQSWVVVPRPVRQHLTAPGQAKL